MKKICLIESESHYEVLRNFTLSVYGHCEVTIFTNHFCYKNLTKLYGLDVTIISYETDLIYAEKMMQEGIFDYKLTTTPPSYPFFVKHSQWFENSDLLIHNMNYWLEPFKNIFFLRHPSLANIKSLGRFLKYLPDLLIRRHLYHKAFRGFIAPSESLFQHYRQYDKLKSFIRLDWHEEALDTSEKDYFQIVIPGTVNHFRDYDGTLNILSEFSHELDKPVKVYLLGFNQMKINVRKYENEKLSIITFDRVLLEEEYIGYLKTSDLGILPLKEEIEHMGILEKKGTSNIAGGVNDFVYVGLKGLVPEFYDFEEMQFQTFSSMADLKDLSKSGVLSLKQGLSKELEKSNADVKNTNLKLISN